MKQRLLSLVLLALLPLLAVQAQTTNYDLRICGTQVTSANASDVLGDGVFSYNAATQTLTVSGDCTTYNAGNIIDSDIDGLVINVATDSKLWLDEGGERRLKVLSLYGNTTIKGNGELSISAMDYGYGIYTNSSLTIEDMKLDIEAHYSCIYLFYGHNDSDSQLTIRNSRVFAYSEDDHDPAFKVEGSLVLEGCYVSRPSGGYVYGSTIVDSYGNPSRDLTISIGENPNPVVPYELVICGKRVTNRNASDVLGDGVFSYDAETQTLTVSGDCTYERENNIINSGIEGLVIDVTANSELKTTSLYNADVMYLTKNTTIKGDGKLTITSESKCGIFCASSTWVTISVTIEDMNIEANCFNECFETNTRSCLTIHNSTIHAQTQSGYAFKCIGGIELEESHITQPVGGYVLEGYIVDSEGNKANEVTIEPGDDPNAYKVYDLFICGSRVTNRNSSDVLGDGAFSYDAENKVLTVSGNCTYTDKIVFSKIEGLTINVASNSELNVTTNQQDAIVLNSKTTIIGDGKLKLSSEKGGGISFLNPLTIEDMNIEINGGQTQCIWGGQTALTIRNSTIHATSSENYGAILCRTITLEGCEIFLPEGGRVENGKIVDSEGNIATEVLILPEGTEVYGLSICGTQVTSVNASDILGDGAFSYDPETKTLTMSGDIIRDEGEIGETILSRIDDLIIDIVDDVTLQCKDSGFALYANALLKGTGVLTIDSEEGCGIYVSDAQLTIEGMTIEANGRWGIAGNPDEEYLIVRNSTIHATGTTGAVCDFTSITLEGCEIALPEGGTVDGGNIVDSEGNIATEVTIGEVKYDLYVCGTQVTSNNAEDILGDRGFSYDAATKTLTVSKSLNIGFEAPIINNEGIDGLTINVTKDVTLQTEHLYVWPIRINANTTVTGKGKLTVKAKKEAGFIVRNHSTLTFDDVRVETEGEYGGVSGVETEYLVVRNAVLHAISTSTSNPAIRRFVSLTLDGVKITLPTNGQFRATGSVNSQMVVDADGNMAREVIIEPVPEEGELMICRKLVTDDNANDVLEDGVFRFNASSKTLYINGDCTYDGTIIDSRLSGLTIVSEGVSSLHSLEFETIKGYNLTFKNSYPTKVVSDNDAAIRLLFKMPTIPVESMQTEIEGHLTIDGCEMEIEGKNYGLYSDVSWDMISDGVLQPQGYYNLYLYTYLTIVNSELIVRGNEAAIYHFTEMNCSGYPVIKPSAGEYHTGYLGNIIDPTEFYYQDQTDPNNPKPATEVIIGDEITAIHDIDANVDTNYSNAVRYNLSGQRVGRDYRGIVIENGKKILVK